MAVGSTALTLLLVGDRGRLCAVADASSAGGRAYLNWVLSQRFMPPIAIIVPVVFMFHYLGAARHACSA